MCETDANTWGLNSVSPRVYKHSRVLEPSLMANEVGDLRATVLEQGLVLEKRSQQCADAEERGKNIAPPLKKSSVEHIGRRRGRQQPTTVDAAGAEAASLPSFLFEGRAGRRECVPSCQLPSGTHGGLDGGYLSAQTKIRVRWR